MGSRYNPLHLNKGICPTDFHLQKKKLVFFNQVSLGYCIQKRYILTLTIIYGKYSKYWHMSYFEKWDITEDICSPIIEISKKKLMLVSCNHTAHNYKKKFLQNKKGLHFESLYFMIVFTIPFKFFLKFEVSHTRLKL